MGTSAGVLALWDLRFGLLLRTWSVNRAGAGDLRRIHQIAIHPGKDKGRWIVVAVEDETASPEEEATNAKKQHGFLVVEVWDIDKGVKVEEFRSIGAGMNVPTSRSLFPGAVAMGGDLTPTLMQEAILDPAQAIEALLLNSTTTTGRPSTNGTRPSRLSTVSPTAPFRTSTVSTSSPPSLNEPSRFPRPGVYSFLVGSNYPSSAQDPERVRYPNSLANSGGDPATRAGAGENQSSSQHLGYLITGGGDRKIRYWDLDRPEKSAVVSSLEADDEKPVFT